MSEQKEGGVGVGVRDGVGGGRQKYPGFVEIAKKNKGPFVQLFFMTGALMLSMRSLGQKHRIHDLQEDTSALQRENSSLSLRMASIKSALLHEASLHPSSPLASTIRTLFPHDHDPSSKINK